MVSTPPAPPPETPTRLRRSAHLSTFAHLGEVYLFHDLYGYLMQMSADVLAVVDAFAAAAGSSNGSGAVEVDEVVKRFDGSFGEQSPRGFVDIFYQHACLVEPGEDELAALWPMCAIRGKWNVWRRQGDRVTLWTAWGDAAVRTLELDEVDTRIWNDIDGERRLAQLRETHDAGRVLALVNRLTHSDVQALKLSMFPSSMYAKRPQMAPPYLASTMPYRRWTPADGAPWGTSSDDKLVSPAAYYQHDVEDAQAQFDHQETTLSHLLRLPHPALHGRTYGAALVGALTARGRIPEAKTAAGASLLGAVAAMLDSSAAAATVSWPKLRVLEIGAGLGFVAEAVCAALHDRDIDFQYTIVELAPALATAQKARLFGEPVTWVSGDVLAVALPEASFDLVIANEMIGDLPAIKLSRPDLGLSLDGSGQAEPAALTALGRPGELIMELGLYVDDATEPLYLMTGAFELMIRLERWLAPQGTAVITEFGERSKWPKLSTHLDHPELSIHFGQLEQAARGLGMTAEFAFVIDLLDVDREQQGLATTRSHFRALRAMLADAGVAIDKIGYTPAMFGDALDGKLALDDLGELRWDKIEDRLMGLVPHEFKAVLVQKVKP